MFKLFSKKNKPIEMITVVGLKYYRDGETEKVEYTTFANDKIGLSNFVLYIDEIIEEKTFIEY